MKHINFIIKLGKTSYKIISEYKGALKPIKIKTKYGKCLTTPNALLNNKNITIRSAINKTEYWINMAKEVHGDKYDYSLVNYKNSCTKVKIICREHGVFEQRATSHLKYGCKKCGDICTAEKQKNNIQKLINSFNNVHNNFYNYDKVKYINMNSDIIITCPIHGDFEQQVYIHSKGSSCSKCSQEVKNKNLGKKQNTWKDNEWEKLAKRSKNFDSFKVYIIRCWNDDEEFYKIGKTYRTIKKRFSGKRTMPYSYEIVKTFEGSSKKVSLIERFLQKESKNFVYLPNISFGGQYECFSDSSFQTLKALVDRLEALDTLTHKDIGTIRDAMKNCILNIENV